MDQDKAELIRAAMSVLGSSKSRRKKTSARANGKLGGRHKGSKDSRPRRKGGDKQRVIYEPVAE